MQFYVLKDVFSTFLMQCDDKVRIEKGGIRRLYVGVLLQVDDLLYLAPLGSPKQKHEQMTEQVDFIKISDKENLGVVNLNNMVPVKESGIQPVYFNKINDEKYRVLLMKQYRSLKSKEQLLKEKATYLRSLSYKDKLTSSEKRILSRCVNFAKLETLVNDY